MSTDDDLSFVATAGGDPDESAVLLLPEHLADIAAFVRSQRAVGWREAAEEIRRVRDQQDGWLWFEVGERLLTMVADHLESIAPGRTTP